MNKTNTPTKKRTIVDYHKLPMELKEQLKLVYSDGFHDDLITYKDSMGHRVTALRLETEQIIYMVRMSKELAYQIMDEDEDFDDEYRLKTTKKEHYMDKHADNDYLLIDDE